MEGAHDFLNEHFITGSEEQKCCRHRKDALGKLRVLEWVTQPYS